MTGLRRAELSNVKSWMTTSDDGQHRGAWKHYVESQLRRWSGIGSCDKAEALPHDPAGQRRWLAVVIGSRIVMNMDASIEPLRDQLWAHALALYRDTAPIVPRKLWQHVADQNRKHEAREAVADDYVDKLDPALYQFGQTISQLMSDAGIDSRDWSRQQYAFSSALTAAGWTREQRRRDGRRQRLFVPPSRRLFS